MPVQDIIEIAGRIVDVAGVVAIVLGAAVATLVAIGALLRTSSKEGVYHRYRQSLGRSILLGLELLVAADIIRTVAIAPTFQSVGVLAVIVLIRTFLSFSLELRSPAAGPGRRNRRRARPDFPSPAGAHSGGGCSDVDGPNACASAVPVRAGSAIGRAGGSETI